jgi:cell division protein FtsQ
VSERVSGALLDRRRAVRFARERRRRTVALGFLAAGALAAGLWWVSSGPLLRLRHVSITGYTRPDQALLVQTVRIVARDGTMTRLPAARVREALARFPWVQSVEVRHDWPLGMSVRVHQARPAAVVAGAGGVRALVSADGRVLGPAEPAGRLPGIDLGSATLRAGDWLRSTGARAPLGFVRGLPAGLAGRVQALRLESGVIVGQLTGGPELRLGTPEDLPLKARALRALVQAIGPKEERASAYVDLSVPDRPAVGGLPADSQSQVENQAPNATNTP